MSLRVLLNAQCFLLRTATPLARSLHSRRLHAVAALQGQSGRNTPEAQPHAHPALQRKKGWHLSSSAGNPIPDTLTVDKKTKFSINDADFTLKLLQELHSGIGAGQPHPVKVVLGNNNICYRALALLRSKNINVVTPASQRPAAPVREDKPPRQAPLNNVRTNQPFIMHSPFLSSDYQETAIGQLVEGIVSKQRRHQTLMGATGTGKTYMMARLIEKLQKPTLILAPNKVLAAQLCNELMEFLPKNAVEFFVSYYDYYLPEAYISSSDTYIDKTVEINEDIDRMRHSATRSLLERRDVVVVASVSCIYGLGMPADYANKAIRIQPGDEFSLQSFVERLESMAYSDAESNAPLHTSRHGAAGPVEETLQHGPISEMRGRYAIVRAQSASKRSTADGYIVIGPSTDDFHVKMEFEYSASGQVVVRSLSQIHPDGAVKHVEGVVLYPATHHVMSDDDKQSILDNIEAELEARCAELYSQRKYLEAERLRQRTEADLLMMRAIGRCKGIENYSRHITRKRPGEPPVCLIDYFPEDWLLLIDESHISVPQVHAMYAGDRARKVNLVNHGFRLPSALDNRPLRGEEFWSKVNNTVFVSATPGRYEENCNKNAEVPLGLAKTKTAPVKLQSRQISATMTPDWGSLSTAEAHEFLKNASFIRHGWWDAEVIIRPTGILDPMVQLRPSSQQIPDLLREIAERKARGERVLITAITKAMAEDLAVYIEGQGFNASYLHSGVRPMQRLDIVRALRRGDIDVLVGVNLLREGLNLPEVSLVAILDADKEGFLRSDTSLIQTIGRASRHVQGVAILYADVVTDSMRRAICETNRRRSIQQEYNKLNQIAPTPAHTAIMDDYLLQKVEQLSNGRKPKKELSRVTARLMGEEEYGLSEEEEAIRDFADIYSTSDLSHLQRLQKLAIERLVEATRGRKYEIAMQLAKIRDYCQKHVCPWQL